MVNKPEIMVDETAWWKDMKLFAGIVLFVLNFIIGFYAKVLFLVKIKEPFYWWLGAVIYAFSWILLFAGVYLLGSETNKLIRSRIKHNVKKSVRKTYDGAMKIRKRSVTGIVAASKIIGNKR